MNSSCVITTPLSETGCQLDDARIDEFMGTHIGKTFMPEAIYA